MKTSLPIVLTLLTLGFEPSDAGYSMRGQEPKAHFRTITTLQKISNGALNFLSGTQKTIRRLQETGWTGLSPERAHQLLARFDWAKERPALAATVAAPQAGPAAALNQTALLSQAHPDSSGPRRAARPFRRSLGNILTPPSYVATDLERRISFFDANGDGVASPGEMYSRLRLLEVPWWKAGAAAAALTLALARPSFSGFALKYGISIQNGIKARHPEYHPGIYDEKGNFNEKRFEELFADGKTAITEHEIHRFMTSMAPRPKDWLDTARHWGAELKSMAEFQFLFDIAADAEKLVNGRPQRAMRKETLKKHYQGTLFYELANSHR